MLYQQAMSDQIAYCSLPVNKTIRVSGKSELFVICYWLFVIRLKGLDRFLYVTVDIIIKSESQPFLITINK
ncbi:hypothetical protein D1AOALGA4SA_4483 [Olavius algarvensis Delta 1 endosymbiont]|nr:hypothetical protein D1AOALGA4SA_4483 [Olavius algarvensis Delta 1 endosymbiont]